MNARDERLDAISQALASLVRQQRQLERRMERIERAFAGSLPMEEEPVRPSPPVVEAAPATAPADPLPPVESSPAVTAALPPRRDVESAVGLTWISRIGAVTLVIGVAFFFKYAFENHWITETGRVLLGAALGAGAIGVGERFWRSGQRTYAQSLSAAGLAFLYLSIWAAYGLYHLMGRGPAFAAMTGVTALAVVLALRYGAQAIAAIGLAGGFLTPLLLDTGRDPWFVLGYALLLAGAAFWLAWRWPNLQILSAIGTAMLYVSQWTARIPMRERAGWTLFTLAFYAVFAAGPSAPAAIAAQLLAGLAAAAISAPNPWALAPPFAIAAAGLGVENLRPTRWRAPACLAGLWLAYLAWSDAAGPNDSVVAPLGFILASYVLFLAWPLRPEAPPLGFGGLAAIALNATISFAAGYNLLEKPYPGWTGLFAVAAALLQMGQSAVLWRRDARAAVLSAGAAWTLLVLAAPIQFAGWRVTMLWSIEAAVLAWMAARLPDRRALWGAMIVFALALCRLLTVDSWMFSTVGSYALLANIRFLTFAVSAAAFFAAAWFSGSGRPAGVLYLGGHLTLLWGLCLEASAQAARMASLPNVASLQSTAVSILAAAYAVALVASGVVRGFFLDRAAGIFLIGLVVLKLYLYDVWLLGLFYRMAAFAVLGALLLGASYLYSRFRNQIDALRRPE